jgi:hypothetical protein
MLTYNKDTDQLELYDGSAFGPVGSDSGLIHIETVSMSAVASQSLNDVFSATYDNYKIILSSESGSGLVTVRLRLRVGGSDDSTANYNFTQLDANGTSVGGLRSTGQTSTDIALASTDVGQNASIEIYRPNLTQPTSLVSTIVARLNSPFGRTYFSEHVVSTAFTGFTIFPSASNITGSVSVYGYAKA